MCEPNGKTCQFKRPNELWNMIECGQRAAHTVLIPLKGSLDITVRNVCCAHFVNIVGVDAPCYKMEEVNESL